MDEYTIADMQFLNTLKHRVQEVTKLLDETGVKKYPASHENHEVKHSVVILLSELQFHNLLPDGVTISSASNQSDAQAENS
jgi:hypothetical protein